MNICMNLWKRVTRMDQADWQYIIIPAARCCCFACCCCLGLMMMISFCLRMKDIQLIILFIQNQDYHVSTHLQKGAVINVDSGGFSIALLSYPLIPPP